MTQQTRITVIGSAGRMGQRIIELIKQDATLTLAGTVDINAPLLPLLDQSDVIIDFSSPASTLQHLASMKDRIKPIVVGTTGFSDSELAELKKHLVKTPSVFAPNMSVGVNVLMQLLATATQVLHETYDIEIVEAHHHHKKDAPSGTALGLAEVIAKNMGKKLADIARYERHGQIGERKPGELGIQTLRYGSEVGTHTVYFGGTGETIELTHRATSRDTFASGAIRAAKWLVGKKPGIYTMRDVLDL